MPKKIIEYNIPPGFVDGTARSVKQRYIRGNLVRFRDGRIRPIGGWQELPLTSDSAQLDSAVRGQHSFRENTGVGVIAFGTKGTGSASPGPQYGQIYIARVANTPVDITDNNAQFTLNSNILLSTNTNYSVGDTLTSAGNIPANTLVVSVSSTTNSSSQYSIQMTNQASANATSQTVTISPKFAKQKLINITPSGYAATEQSEFKPGYGYWFYGLHDFGSTYSGSGTISFTKLSHFTMDNFGQKLVGTHSGSKIMWVWENDDTQLATPITNAPNALAVVVTAERHIFALGANNDTRKIAWCSQEQLTDWTPSATNSAGDHPLQTTGNLVCGRVVSGGVLIWTDTDTHIARYLGVPLVYSFQKMSDNSGVDTPYAIHSSSEITAWLNKSGFWAYDGYVKPLPSPISDRVLRTVDWTQSGLIVAGGNAEFGEIWWWCPSRTGTAGQCGYYVIYNYRDNQWYDSATDGSGIFRNSWMDKSVTNSPLAVDPVTNKIMMHESTSGTQTEEGFAETGSIDLLSGERFSRISKIYTDTEQQVSGDVNMKFFTADSAESTEVESPNFAVESDGVITTRLQGRQLRMRVSGKLLNDWTVGATRLEYVAPGGYR